MPGSQQSPTSESKNLGSESKNLGSESKKLEDQNSQTTEIRSAMRTLSVEPREFQGRNHRIQVRDRIQIRNRIQIRDRIVREFQKRASLNSTLRIDSVVAQFSNLATNSNNFKRGIHRIQRSKKNKFVGAGREKTVDLCQHAP